MCNSILYQKIREEVDIMDAIEYFGLEYSTKGSHIHIRCPEHLKNIGHEDANMGNCVLYENSYHCFACGGHGDIINLIANHFDISYYDAASQIACVFGISVNEENSFLPLTRKELNSLHLTSTAKISLPISYGEKRDGYFDGQGYVHCNKQTKNLADFYKEDKIAFFKMICGKVSEWQPVYEQLIHDLTTFLKKNGANMTLLMELEEIKTDLRNLNNVKFKIAHDML